MIMHTPWLRLFVLSVLSAGSLCLLATPLQPPWGDMRVKHAWNAVPSNWKHLSHPAPETVIDLYIALKPQNETSLIDALLEVSDPVHPKYGAHMSREQVAELVAPHPDTLELVHSWLEHHGVPSSSVSTSHGGGWLAVTGVPVSKANTLLGASYQHYQHAETKDRVLRTLSYAIPKDLHVHVQAVTPTTYFGFPRTQQETPRKRSERASTGESVNALSSRDPEDTMVHPSLLRWRYGTLSYVPAATATNKLIIMGNMGNYPSLSDMITFMEIYRTDADEARFTIRQNGGGPLPNGASQGANLVSQYAEAMTWPTPVEYYSIAAQDNFITLMTILLDLPTVPQTISLSFGDIEQNVPPGLADVVCNLFGRLGMRGASILVASGDFAVGNMTADCRADDGTPRFLPIFPATCPWVTSVGGTVSIFGGSFHPDDEIAGPHSSGGFSNYFPRPTYQNNAVASYLQNFQERYDGRYNVHGRGFPDVAALSEIYPFIFRGQVDRLWGTGCATPTMAGVVSLMNDYLIAHDFHPLGFLNLWLYGRGYPGFHDITYGANPGCTTAGFLAMPGWDPVTGFGSPRFQDFLRLVWDEYDPMDSNEDDPMDQDSA